MDSAINALFNYLRDAIYEPDKASLVIEDLPEEFQEFGRGLNFYVECVKETTTLAFALSRGELDGAGPSRGNEIAAPLKSLHASLRHLTWQAQRISEGDYAQRVAFMGEFADAFNTMVVQLAEREQNLEDQIWIIEEKTAALEQGNTLLSSLIGFIPQQIFVADRYDNDIVLMNELGSDEMKRDKDYMTNIIRLISEQNDPDKTTEIDIAYVQHGIKRYFIVNKFFLKWHGEDADIYAINDVSATRREIENLETQAYQDELTGLYNRAYGMMMLDSYLEEQRAFSLIFVDLDSLKFVNDVFSHAEGDIYISRAGGHLKTLSDDAVVCRIGGDEYMVLVPGFDYDTAHKRMSETAHNLRNDEYQMDKEYSYNMSFGIASVEKGKSRPAGEILGEADLKMYEDKQKNKAKKQAQRQSGYVDERAIEIEKALAERAAAAGDEAGAGEAGGGVAAEAE